MTTHLIIQTAGSIEWRLHETLPVSYGVEAFPGMSIRNPLHWTDFENEFLSTMRMGWLNNALLMSTRGLVLETESGSTDGGASLSAFDNVSEVLRRLRHVSGQFLMPTMVVAATSELIAADTTPIGESRNEITNARVRNYMVPTAISGSHLQTVGHLPTDYDVPIHAEVLLDALQAHVEHDFRKALLCAAIAVESFARQRLQAAADENVRAAAPQHRTASFTGAGGSTTNKDPIAELLLQSDSFTKLLHEAPLYILGRSLLLDRPNTYRDMTRLYSTRNKIAHMGMPPNEEKYFAMTMADAKVALHAAISALEWFGGGGSFIVWDGGLVPLRDNS